MSQPSANTPPLPPAEIIPPNERMSMEEARKLADALPGLCKIYFDNLDGTRPLINTTVFMSGAATAGLGIATFSSKVKGAWKIAAGVGTALLGITTVGLGATSAYACKSKTLLYKNLDQFFDEINKNPALREEFVRELQNTANRINVSDTDANDKAALANKMDNIMAVVLHFSHKKGYFTDAHDFSYFEDYRPHSKHRDRSDTRGR